MYEIILFVLTWAVSILKKLTFCNISTFLQVLTMVSNCLCSFGPNFWGPKIHINKYKDTQSTFSRVKKGRIEQGPIVQGQIFIAYQFPSFGKNKYF